MSISPTPLPPLLAAPTRAAPFLPSAYSRMQLPRKHTSLEFASRVLPASLSATPPHPSSWQASMLAPDSNAQRISPRQTTALHGTQQSSRRSLMVRANASYTHARHPPAHAYIPTSLNCRVPPSDAITLQAPQSVSRQNGEGRRGRDLHARVTHPSTPPPAPPCADTHQHLATSLHLKPEDKRNLKRPRPVEEGGATRA